MQKMGFLGYYLQYKYLLSIFSYQPITDSPPKWMAELESEDIEMLKGKNFFLMYFSFLLFIFIFL